MPHPDRPAAALPDLTPVVQRLHQSPWQAVLAITGGGTEAISQLLRVPGASRTVLAAIVPYSQAALTDWLGITPEQACSEATARAMAMVAFQQGIQWLDDGDRGVDVPLVGLGATAALASDRPKRGQHRVHLAFQTANITQIGQLILSKGARTRAEEDGLVSAWIVTELAKLAGLDIELTLPSLPDDKLTGETFTAQSEWAELLLNKRAVVGCGPAAAVAESRQSRSRRLILPGAFNPLHDGHRHMAQLAAEKIGRPAEFEISLTNVDKAPLDFLDLSRRLNQFDAETGVWLTRAPRFTEKAELFPESVFAVGADTIERIAAPRYYGSQAERDQAVATLQGQGCRFLVFGRSAAGDFKTLAKLGLPSELLAICEQVPQEEFHLDISSTELRRQADHSLD